MHGYDSQPGLASTTAMQQADIIYARSRSSRWRSPRGSPAAADSSARPGPTQCHLKSQARAEIAVHVHASIGW
ncbi:MAG TPA: hypothetical protein VLW50_08430 [Streptosporangiaceae bacterium]|nr:hypothetical protein [Streptosporangiaceae bacterium]